VFKGEKTNLFWTGLIILGFASLVVFTAIWQNIISYINYLSYSNRYSTAFAYSYVWSYIPIIVGGVIFILIGLYMMKSGVRKEQLNTPKAS
jgi:putative Mn2+ efflux pump MntP